MITLPHPVVISWATRFFSRKQFAFIFLLFYRNNTKGKRVHFSYEREKMLFVFVLCVLYNISIRNLGPVMASSTSTTTTPLPTASTSTTTTAVNQTAVVILATKAPTSRVPVGGVSPNYTRPLPSPPRSRNQQQQQQSLSGGLFSTNFQHLENEDDYFDDDDDNVDDELKQIEQLKKNGSERGAYIGAPCEFTCSNKLHHVFCDPTINQCSCEKPYPVIIGVTKGCAKSKKLGEQCFYDQTCAFNDINSLCVQVKHNALCGCIDGYHSVVHYKPSKREFCTPDMAVLTSDLPTLLGVSTGIAVLAGLICMVLHLFSKTKYPRNRGHFADANLPPPILYSSDTGIPLTIQSARPSSRSSLRSGGSISSYCNRRPSNCNSGTKGILVSTSRTGAARSAAILLISCHISALKANKYHNPQPPTNNSTNVDIHSNHSYQETNHPSLQQMPRNFRANTTTNNNKDHSAPLIANTEENVSVDSGTSAVLAIPDQSHFGLVPEYEAYHPYHNPVMAKYIERQLNQQRHLLSLELPEILSNRSNLNSRFRRILGLNDPESDLDDPHHFFYPAYPSSDPENDDDDEDDLDQAFCNSLENIVSHCVEQGVVLPTPASDTAKFAVINPFTPDRTDTHKHLFEFYKHTLLSLFV